VDWSDLKYLERPSSHISLAAGSRQMEMSVPGVSPAFSNHPDGFLVRLEVRREAALVAHAILARLRRDTRACHRDGENGSI